MIMMESFNSQIEFFHLKCKNRSINVLCDHYTACTGVTDEHLQHGHNIWKVQGFDDDRSV